MGKQAKSMSTVESLCRHFALAGLTRADVVIGVGGGVVTDVAGFAASCYHRGTPVVHVATTLLGQIDAAIGGKTGVNLPEGKNLVGAFCQPTGVFCDTDTLWSLPEREWRSGFGEMAKYAFLGVDDLDRLPLVEQAVARCAALKADVVAADERESGRPDGCSTTVTLLRMRSKPPVLPTAPAAAASIFATVRRSRSVSFSQPAWRADSVASTMRGSSAIVEVVALYGLPSEIPSPAPISTSSSASWGMTKATDGLTFVLDGPGGIATSPVSTVLVVVEACRARGR